jgi:nicotinamidase-related amidase
MGFLATISHKVLNKNNWPKRLRVCGVNTDACVRSTIEGLVWKFDFKAKNISLITSACAGYDTKRTLSCLLKQGFVFKKR